MNTTFQPQPIVYKTNYFFFIHKRQQICIQNKGFRAMLKYRQHINFLIAHSNAKVTRV